MSEQKIYSNTIDYSPGSVIQNLIFSTENFFGLKAILIKKIAFGFIMENSHVMVLSK